MNGNNDFANNWGRPQGGAGQHKMGGHQGGHRGHGGHGNGGHGHGKVSPPLEQQQQPWARQGLPAGGNNNAAAPIPNNAAPAAVPQPNPTPTPQQVDEIIKRFRTKLFERLQPLVNGDRTDFTVNAHSGKLEFCFPVKGKQAILPLLQVIVEHVKGQQNSGSIPDICINILRERFLICRIKEPTPSRFGPPYRLEVMVPVDGVGNGLLMASAESIIPTDVDLSEKLYKTARSGSAESATAKEGEADADGEEDRATIAEKLKGLGVDVLLPNEESRPQEDGKGLMPASNADELWASIAGYDDTKAAVKQCITLPLLRPDLIVRMSQLTRGKGEGKKTSGVLFTGPPGVGKTTMARVAAHAAAMPLVYVPVESVVSKWYGEAEQKLRAVFEQTRKLGNAVLFLDELDAFAGNRDGGIHEVTRRILSVLLRQLDGLDAGNDKDKSKEGEEGKEPKPIKHKHVVLVGATNRVQDLDAALCSRFNKIVEFPLPDEQTRSAIFGTYAAHLTPAELAQLGNTSTNFSGRDIRETCDDAEHLWVAQLLDQGGFNISLSKLEPPPATSYAEAVSVKARQKTQG